MFKEPTNDDRAGWAMVAVDAFARETRLDTAGEDLFTKLGDLMADLMHLCRLNQVDFEQILAAGRLHFSEEVQEELDQRYVSGVWGHIFGGARNETNLRFVFDRCSSSIVCMQIQTHNGYEAATREAMEDVQESLLVANDVLDDPEENGLEITAQVPEWAIELMRKV